MSRYIDADELLKEASKDGAYGYVSAEQIADFPTADVVEVRHGRWEDRGSLSCRCSECGCKANKETAYCPNCGASMVNEDVVRHGRWIPTLIMGDRGSAGYSCSVCHKFNKTDSDYCPNCGASMGDDTK